MGKTVIVTVTTNSTKFPSGTEPAGVLFTIPGVPPQTITAAPYAATFTGVAPGTYTATAQAVDVSGNPLGAAWTSTSFTVDDDSDTVSVDIPASGTVAVQ